MRNRKGLSHNTLSLQYFNPWMVPPPRFQPSRARAALCAPQNRRPPKKSSVRKTNLLMSSHSIETNEGPNIPRCREDATFKRHMQGLSPLLPLRFQRDEIAASSASTVCRPRPRAAPGPRARTPSRAAYRPSSHPARRAACCGPCADAFLSLSLPALQRDRNECIALTDRPCLLSKK